MTKEKKKEVFCSEKIWSPFTLEKEGKKHDFDLILFLCSIEENNIIKSCKQQKFHFHVNYPFKSVDPWMAKVMHLYIVDMYMHERQARDT